ncbi:hypothetical protein GCM10010344_00140 [Streptomyces bluensis]|uniref:transposase n=1 Tax=Streptomyces bluensis TaxID=33897 RepID=UPI0019942FAA|nr:transposase [Streptomyces bluensis]GGZ39724.1 hypothetical protein GCM10010344_00140 [Streptomyces bluensis]
MDRELYLPQSWTSDADRCRAAKVPDSRVFATKGELARAMILRALASPLPIAWVTGDCVYGQEWRMRRTLEEAATPAKASFGGGAGRWRSQWASSSACIQRCSRNLRLSIPGHDTSTARQEGDFISASLPNQSVGLI